MLTTPPPGPSVPTMNRQFNQLLGAPSLTNPQIPASYTSSYSTPSSMGAAPSYLPAQGAPQQGQMPGAMSAMVRALSR